jgi:hypothetical protein
LEKSTLIPFVRKNLDILFVGLNPAKGSSHNRHYFSVNQSFWNQLFEAGLIIVPVDKTNADEKIFGSTDFNYQGWSYGITDLVPKYAESDSKKIKPKHSDCENLAVLIRDISPRVVILLHSKVMKYFIDYVNYPLPSTNYGQIGNIIPGCTTKFFNIAFPHGNAIPSKTKVENYRHVKQYLISLNHLDKK